MKKWILAATLLFTPVIASSQVTGLLVEGPAADALKEYAPIAGMPSGLTQTFVAQRSHLLSVSFWAKVGAMYPDGVRRRPLNVAVTSGIGLPQPLAGPARLAVREVDPFHPGGLVTLSFVGGLPLTVGNTYSVVFFADICECGPGLLEAENGVVPQVATSSDWYAQGRTYFDANVYDYTASSPNDLFVELRQATVPEPSTWLLTVTGLAGLYRRARERRLPSA